MAPETTEGKIEMARIGQRLEDHVIQYDKDTRETKENFRGISNDISDIKTILTTGEGKIGSNKKDIQNLCSKLGNHKKKHLWNSTTKISVFTSIIALLALLVAYFN